MRDYAELVKALRDSESCNAWDAADTIEELLAERDKYKEAFAQENSARIAAMEVALRKWISVEERLPEPYQNVLTCAWKLFGADRKLVYGIDYTTDNGEWACGGESYKTMVTHWMPLPEPPKEDADVE